MGGALVFLLIGKLGAASGATIGPGKVFAGATVTSGLMRASTINSGLMNGVALPEKTQEAINY